MINTHLLKEGIVKNWFIVLEPRSAVKTPNYCQSNLKSDCPDICLEPNVMLASHSPIIKSEPILRQSFATKLWVGLRTLDCCRGARRAQNWPSSIA